MSKLREASAAIDDLQRKLDTLIDAETAARLKWESLRKQVLAVKVDLDCQRKIYTEECYKLSREHP